MKVHDLSQQNSVINNYLIELREQNIQRDGLRFRRNIERIGELLGYEISKSLNYKPFNGNTLLGKFNTNIVSDSIVLCSILRAGIPLHNGLLNIFDSAENAFISAYRHHNDNDDGFEIKVEYLTCPSLEDKVLILADPMLATGRSIKAVISSLKPYGLPKRLILLCIIGSKSGVAYLNKHLAADTELWIASIDEGLNSKGYIVPGLGDAGDLAFGNKLQQ